MNSRYQDFRSIDSRRQAGFTLVELLVVIGIIGVILSIAIPVSLKARKSAFRARAVRDIEALRTGLEEFKNIHNEYPQVYYPNFAPNTDPRNAKNGVQALYAGLVGLDQQGNNVVNPKSNRPAGAIINVESFHVRKGMIADESDNPYLYFPATVPSPDITKTQGGKGTFVADNSARLPPLPLYNHSDAPTSAPVLKLEDMQFIMGDGFRYKVTDSYHPYVPPGVSPNGFIDPTPTPIYGQERASSTAPYLLWAAGQDGIFGFDTNGATDDITSFEIPAVYMRR